MSSTTGTILKSKQTHRVNSNSPASSRPVKVRGIALPTEHGAWGMLFEPLVAASVVAFSITSLWISLAVIAAFLMRQPLKVFLITRRAGRIMPQSRVAVRFFFYYFAVFALGAAGTLVTSDYRVLLPLIVAAPLAPIPIYFDSIGKSRKLAPELAGTLAITSSATVIALAGGWTLSTAAALWLVLICRWIPSILYVRSRLLLEKGKPYNASLPVIASAGGVMVSAALAYYDLAPWLAAIVMVILFIRAFIGLSRYSLRRKARQIGVLEVVFGCVTVIAIIVGYQFDL